ncbi:hypothetical protein M408DRAFT_333579 [Serendipita vermifera MAFF 305830]|uniref:WSC domain-containing protein n=1 Tax=Serendipita vermifera MAFF 305830 TaxID=933852 RepID=A0A0C2W474_SERVB|nr:hypothetical protein M408DRAFT_333579 [Serendipita vermifera MAFF 305830]
MASTVFSKLALFLTLLSLTPSTVNASWRMVANTIVTGRVDPLINPNAVSGHVHDYAGGSNFGVTYDHDDMRSSSCSSVEIPEDKSGYWSPAVYYHVRDGSYKLLKSSYMVYYLHRGSNIKAFPKGFRMIAGSAVKNTVDPNDPASAAINYHCLGGGDGETLQFPEQYCPQGVRVQILFPSCWNGNDITSANFKDHVRYPVDGKEGNTCPDGFGTRLITLFLEHIIYMDGIDWYPGSLTLANGDSCGWSSHADFAMGWDPAILQQAVDQCTDSQANLDACDLLRNMKNSGSAAQCQPVKYLPLEDVGFYGTIPQLLGNNQQWGCGATKATTGSSNTPPLVAPYSVLANGWSEHGCIDEGDPYTNAMNGDKLVDNSMSPRTCVAYCDGKGFSMAAVASGDTCFCANTLEHNASMNLVDFGKCLMPCAGSHYEWCGGGRNLRLYTKTGEASVDSSYNYPPAGARLSQVYTSNGSSVPVVAPPTTGSTGTTTSTGSNDGNTSSDGNTVYGPSNPPKCSRRALSRKRRSILKRHARKHGFH